MESNQIYEESYSALNNLKKQLNSNSSSITIDFSKFDVTTNGDIRQALKSTVIHRMSEVTKVISKAK